MQLLKRFLPRVRRSERRPEDSKGGRTSAEQDSANKYWKAEVASDQERRGKPEKRE